MPMSPGSDELRAWQASRCAAEPHYEFGGPIGALGIMVGLPLVTLMLYVGCGRDFCVTDLDSAAELPGRLAGALVGDVVLWSWDAAAVVCGWTVLHFALYVLLPGREASGVVLSDGSRLTYRLNGHLAFWLCALAVAVGVPMPADDGSGLSLQPLPLAWLYDHYIELMSASLAVSLAISVWCYASSLANSSELLAAGGHTGNALYDFFIGRPLNPRLGSLDLKARRHLLTDLLTYLLTY